MFFMPLRKGVANFCRGYGAVAIEVGWLMLECRTLGIACPRFQHDPTES